ncbi:MAG TPA: ATP-binding cassette domain-containing protein [Candidatus Aquilonibacter sp.]|nr:ATP-binding cassette domain-containing protein [Candidatus Aquilonibacter sp.]
MAATATAAFHPELSPGTPVVEFSHVSVAFDRGPVLEDVSFTVMHGETRIMLGPAGVGKSVIMKLANGLITPDSGEVRIFGRLLSDLTPREMFEMRAHIGMVFQESALFDSLDVEDNVAYRLEEEHCDPAEIHTRVVEALRFVELEHAINKYPSELSGGMRRRVSIARAIISKPDLILYDSPTGGLDPITSTTIIELIVKQRDVSQTTSLLITHRMQDAFTLATHRYNTASNQMRLIPNNGIDPGTKFLVFNDTRVVFDGTTQELTHTTDPWLQGFIS